MTDANDRNTRTDLTPGDVAGLYSRPEPADDADADSMDGEDVRADLEPPLHRLLTPAASAASLAALARASEPLTGAEIAEAANLSRSAFDRNKDDLLESGVVETAGKKGNAQTYRLAPGRPVAQLLQMASNVANFGVTPDLFDRTFEGQPGSGRDVE